MTESTILGVCLLLSIFLQPACFAANDSAGDSTGEHKESEQFKLQLWQRIIRSWAPPRDGERCKTPSNILQLHKSGLVLSVKEGNASDCKSLSKSCNNAIWFGAPYASLPEWVGDRANFRIILTPLKMSSSNIVLMQTPGQQIAPTRSDFSTDIPPDLIESFEKLRTCKTTEVANYFESNDFPRSIPFVLSKNIWMQIVRYQAIRRKVKQPLLQILNTIPPEWVGAPAKLDRIKELGVTLDASLAKGVNVNSDREFCVGLADFLQLLASSSHKASDGKSPPNPD